MDCHRKRKRNYGKILAELTTPPSKKLLTNLSTEVLKCS
jgi:hypothetical protein